VQNTGSRETPATSTGTSGDRTIPTLTAAEWSGGEELLCHSLFRHGK
jgi:hypothetical protein